MRTRTVQSSFLSGVLDRRAQGRVETDAYNNGVLRGDNVVVHHLGGIYRRDGFAYLQTLPNVLEYFTPDSATAPNGGTAANGYDQSDSTSVITSVSIGTTDPYVVLRYDLGEAKSVAHVDIHNLEVTSGSTDEFFIEFSQNDSDWFVFASVAPTINTITRTFRRSSFSIEGEPSTTSARYWRLVKVGGTSLSATATLTQMNLWGDTGALSNVRLFAFEKTTDIRFVVAVTDRSATVLFNGAVPSDGTFPLPYASADIPDLDYAVGNDLLYLTHEDYPPRFVSSEDNTGQDMETGEIPFDTLPQTDFDDASSPTSVSEVQVITFDVNWNRGDTFQIELDGARTALISFAGDSTADERTTTAENIAREVQKLFSVPGFSGVTCSRTGALAYTVTFADASAKAYDGLISVTVGTTSSTTVPSATVVRSVGGTSRFEDAWGATRGYPRTVAFFGGRLYFGGSKSLLQSLFGTGVNNITNFELLEQLDADPIFVTLNGQQLNAINGLFSGNTLELFTSGGEYRYIKQEGEAITPADRPIQQTQYGSKRIRPVSIDGVTVFVQRLGKSIRDFNFNFERDRYDSLGLSSLAPNLIADAVDIAAWQGSSTDDINLVLVVNADGTVAVLNLRREAEVRAWTRWFTGSSATVDEVTDVVSGHDNIKAVETTVGEIYFAVNRTINGVSKLFVERTQNEMFVDAGVNVNAGVASNVAHLSAETCRCRLQTDDIVLADVTGGTVTPSEPEYGTGTAIQVGLNFNPTVRPMPLQSMTPLGSNFMDKRRVRKARVRVHETLGLSVNGRSLPDRYFDVSSFDDAPDRFSGNHQLEESDFWDEAQDKLVTFSQINPLPMHILAIVIDMETG